VRGLAFIILMALSGSCWAEGGCFRSIAEAVAQSGVRDDAGFRAVDVRRDAFSQLTWAKVVSCGRPEAPPVVVRTLLSSITVSARSAPTQPSTLKTRVAAGARVSVVRLEEHLRLVTIGTAMTSGRIGDRVRVKLEPLLDGGADRFVVGVVKTDGTLEMAL
jgi:hypothetical protein